MKKLTVLLVFLMSLNIGQAQEIEFGPKLGANFSNLSGVTDASNKTGFVGGVFLNLRFENIAISPELLYSQQGAEFDALSFDLNYINVPVIFKYYLIGGFNLQAGPQFGFVVDDNLSEQTVLNAESFDLSGSAGIGIDLPLGIRADARYTFGLKDSIEELDSKHGIFTISVGYNLF